ncbi:MAG: DUF6541 family protein [Patescibacteria group bacterium]
MDPANNDNKFFWLIVTIAVVMTLIPHLIGWGRVINNEFAEYQAYNTYAVADTNVYYSYINQAKEGQLLFANNFTSEPQSPSMFHPLWLLGGWLSFITKLSAPVIFQILRVVAGSFMLWAVYRFLIWLQLSKQQRRWVFPIIVLGSGLGFFLAPWSDFSIYRSFFSTDISIAESNTFATLYHSPLFPLSQALIILSLQYFITAWREQKKKLLVLSGLTVLILSLVHTYDLITVAAVLLAYGLIKLLRSEISNPPELRRYIKYGLGLIPFAVPAVIYYLVIMSREPAIAGWLKQNITLSPTIWSYLLGYGLLVPLAIAGAGKVLKENYNRSVLLIVWLVTGLVLMYFPYLQIQRRLTNGMHIPLAILAGLGLMVLWQWAVKRSRWLSFPVMIIALAGLIATPIAVIVRDSLSVSVQDEKDHRYYFTETEKSSYEFLAEEAGKDDIIYSHPWTGNVLAGQGRLVFLGHGHQTVDWDTKRAQIDGFFTDWSDNNRQEYLANNSIKYLYYGPAERKLGEWDPAKALWLRQIWGENDIAIYKYPAI